MKLLGRFPSFDVICKNAWATLARFPFALLTAMVGAALAIIIIDSDNPDKEHTLHKLLMLAGLGLPLFIALKALAEKRKWKPGTAYGIQLLGLVLLMGYYFTLPTDPTLPAMHMVRFLLLVLGLHFLVAWLPYVNSESNGGFWQYNTTLFLRFLLAAFYSAVLYGGLAIALAAADHLFGMDVKEIRYMQLWALIAGLFNTWLFLAGVPGDFERLDQERGYPKGLNVFTQYILLPLVGLYFVILIAYEAKIIITWNWPKGWVSQLVLWYSVVGLLSLLLLHPLRDLRENRWIQRFSSWFFRALIPLIIMLFLAIARRISDYGVTENRYFVLAMAIGLAVVTLYFLFSKVKDIRIIPVVLTALAFLSAFGPWSAFSISKGNQMARLEGLLVKNELIHERTLSAPAADIPSTDLKEMSSIVSYISDWHGPEPFSTYLSDSALQTLDGKPRYDHPELIAGMMGFEYLGRWQTQEDLGHFSITTPHNPPLVVTGFDYFIDFSVAREFEPVEDSLLEVSYFMESDTCVIDTCVIRFDRFQAVLTISVNVDGNWDAAELNLYEPLRSIVDSSSSRWIELPEEKLTFSLMAESFESRIMIPYATGSLQSDTLKITTLGTEILLRRR